MSDLTLNTGTTVGISATLPTTFDSDEVTGYAASTFTLIGEIVDVSEIAKTFATVSHQAVTRAYPIKEKDTYDIPDITINVANVTSDAGQVIVATALNDANSYAFEVTSPSGDLTYITGKVTKSGKGSAASGSFETSAITIAIDPESLFEA